jgi:hypothetical protein
MYNQSCRSRLARHRGRPASDIAEPGDVMAHQQKRNPTSFIYRLVLSPVRFDKLTQRSFSSDNAILALVLARQRGSTHRLTHPHGDCVLWKASRIITTNPRVFQITHPTHHPWPLQRTTSSSPSANSSARSCSSSSPSAQRRSPTPWGCPMAAARTWDGSCS